MAEYIDREKLIRDLIDNRSFYPAIVKNAIENAPTEDVVPRSEVEKIFEEIEKRILKETTKSRTIIKDGVNRCFSDYLEGQIVMLQKIPVWLAELKKKYIGE